LIKLKLAQTPARWVIRRKAGGLAACVAARQVDSVKKRKLIKILAGFQAKV
jgi:carbon monoxide dehydrogenase subunit G